MKVSHLSVVTLDYTVSDESGDVLDSTEGHEPLVYLHGAGFLVPGLEIQQKNDCLHSPKNFWGQGGTLILILFLILILILIGFV